MKLQHPDDDDAGDDGKKDDDKKDTKNKDDENMDDKKMDDKSREGTPKSNHSDVKMVDAGTAVVNTNVNINIQGETISSTMVNPNSVGDSSRFQSLQTESPQASQFLPSDNDKDPEPSLIPKPKTPQVTEDPETFETPKV